MAEAMSPPPPPPSWSDIPLELAGLVLRRLPAHVDRVRFTAVCPQWRRAAREVPLPAPLPLLALSDGTVYSLPGTAPFRFPGCAGYVDACGSWLAFSGEDGCFLRNPFTDATVTLPQQFRVRGHQYHAGDETGVTTWKEIEDTPEQLTMYKLVFCSPQLIATLVRFEKIARVAVCQPGAASWWSVDTNHQFPLTVDMAFHQGKLYVLEDSRECLFAIDITVDNMTGDPWVSRVRHAILPSATTVAINGYVNVKMLYLVEQHGALLMVRRRMHGRWKTRLTRAEMGGVIPTGHNEFEVFRADFLQSKWIKVTTIGDDQVLFLWRRCSRSVRVSEEEMMPRDRIVFLENDDEDHSWFKVGTSGSCSVYDMRDGKVSIFPMASWKRGSVPATWLFP